MNTLQNLVAACQADETELRQQAQARTGLIGQALEQAQWGQAVGQRLLFLAVDQHEQLDALVDGLQGLTEGRGLRTGRRVLEVPGQHFVGLRQCRALQRLLVTQGDHIIEVLAGEFVDALAAQARRGDAHLLQRRQCPRIGRARPAAGAEHLILLATGMP